MTGLERKRRPTTPGIFLKEDYLRPRKIKIGALAEAVGMSQKHLSQVINGHQRVTPTMAMRLSKVLNTSPQLWLNMQAAVDGYDAEQAAKEWQPKTVFETA